MEIKDSIEWMKKSKLAGFSEEISPALEKIFKDCLNATDEKIIIVSDKGSANKQVASVLSYGYYLAGKNLGLDIDFVLQNKKTRGDKAEEHIVERLSDTPNNSIIIAIMSDKLGSLKHIGKSFRRFCQRKNHRFVSTASIGYISTEKIKDMIEAIDIDYKKFSAAHYRLKRVLDKGKELHVSTVAGTDAYFDISNIKSLCSDGIYTTPGTGGNLPAGEVFMAPRKVDGKIVIDASSRNIMNTQLVKSPIILTVEKGEVVDIKDGNAAKLLEKSLKWAEENAKYPNRVRQIGEIGIGLNPKAKIVGSTILDEKMLGTAHIAIGSNYWFGGPIRTIIHLDQVFRKPMFKLDGESLNVNCEL